MKDRTGEQFGLLTAVRPCHQRGRWIYRCQCGSEKSMWPCNAKAAGHCGCVVFQKRSKSHTRHGNSYLREYKCWGHLKSRCLDPNNKDYHLYGGRGIKVCDRWLESFENFLEDMGPRPSPQHSLDRKDNDSHYCKENCRWAVAVQQQNNKRSNRLVELGGQVKSVQQWCAHLGIKSFTVYARLKRGWSVVDALQTPPETRFLPKNDPRKTDRNQWFSVKYEQS